MWNGRDGCDHEFEIAIKKEPSKIFTYESATWDVGRAAADEQRKSKTLFRPWNEVAQGAEAGGRGGGPTVPHHTCSTGRSNNFEYIY